MVEKQAKFLLLISKFIPQATMLGYDITAGEFWRPEAVAKMYDKKGIGIKNSLHCQRLAADLNAFYNGEYLDGSKDYHIPHLTKLGELWESLNEECAWGGRFSKKDYNHYSLMHNGVM